MKYKIKDLYLIYMNHKGGFLKAIYVFFNMFFLSHFKNFFLLLSISDYFSAIIYIEYTYTIKKM